MNKNGYGVIEVTVAAGLASVIALSIFQLVVATGRPVSAGARQTEATYLAEEALEAVRVLRNDSWSNEIAPLSNNTVYYPVKIATDWTLTTTPPAPINSLYTRTIQLQAVYRDANDDISASGTLDPKTRKVTATVTWPERGQAKTITLDTYLTNFLGT